MLSSSKYLTISTLLITVVRLRLAQWGLSDPGLGLLLADVEEVHVELDEALGNQNLPDVVIVVVVLPRGLHVDPGHLLVGPVHLLVGEGVGYHLVEQSLSGPGVGVEGRVTLGGDMTGHDVLQVRPVLFKHLPQDASGYSDGQPLLHGGVHLHPFILLLYTGFEDLKIFV